MKVLVVNTAYWSEIMDFGLNRIPLQRIPSELLSKLSGSAPAVAKLLTDRGVDSAIHIANAPAFHDSGALSRSKLFLLKYWQIVSRIPVLGGAFNLFGPIGKSLVEAVELEQPDLIYCMNPNLMTPALARALSSRCLLVGQIASPLPPKRFFKSFDLMISALPSHVNRFRRWGIKAEYLPLAIEQSLIQERPLPLSQRVLDVSFIGSFSRHHRNTNRLMRSIGAAFPQLKIFSPTSLSVLRKLGLARFYAGRAWGAKLKDVYSNTKVVINRHGAVADGYAVNFRMFEALAGGAILLTEAAPNLSQLFEVGVEVLDYSSADELIAKISSVLADPDSYQSVATNGIERLRAEHTLDKRVDTLAKLLLERYGHLE